MANALLGLDVGTTFIKVVAYDPGAGKVVDSAARPTPVDRPSPGRGEHDPDDLWGAAAACLREVTSNQRTSEISGLAVSSFGEAGLPVNASGDPLYPIVSWFDRRCEQQVRDVERVLPAEKLHEITGQQFSTSPGIYKWLWIRANEPGVASRTARWLSAPDYLHWRLTGEYATDFSIASRTSLLDQRTRTWSDEMMSLAGLRAEQLPKPRPSGTVSGVVSRRAAEVTGLPSGLPCVLGGHDHLCAALAAGGYRDGSVVDSSGSAQAVIMVMREPRTGEDLARGGFPCYAHVIPSRFALKAGSKAAGRAVEWLARLLTAQTEVGEREYVDLEESARSGIGSRSGPLWLPHLQGSGTPEGDRQSRGSLVGVQIDHSRGDLFRGLLESLACYLRTNLTAMQRLSGQTIRNVTLLGGLTRMRLLTQLKADVLNRPVRVSRLPEAAAVGAALLAGTGVGLFATCADAVGSLDYPDAIVEPDPARADYYERLYETAYVPLYESLRSIHHHLAELAPDVA